VIDLESMSDEELETLASAVDEEIGSRIRRGIGQTLDNGTQCEWILDGWVVEDGAPPPWFNRCQERATTYRLERASHFMYATHHGQWQEATKDVKSQ
jgi:hypothetical protein